MHNGQESHWQRFGDANSDVNVHGHARIGHGLPRHPQACVADENLKATSKYRSGNSAIQLLRRSGGRRAEQRFRTAGVPSAAACYLCPCLMRVPFFSAADQNPTQIYFFFILCHLAKQYYFFGSLVCDWFGAALENWGVGANSQVYCAIDCFLWPRSHALKPDLIRFFFHSEQCFPLTNSSRFIQIPPSDNEISLFGFMQRYFRL